MILSALSLKSAYPAVMPHQLTQAADQEKTIGLQVFAFVINCQYIS